MSIAGNPAFGLRRRRALDKPVDPGATTTASPVRPKTERQAATSLLATRESYQRPNTADGNIRRNIGTCNTSCGCSQSVNVRAEAGGEGGGEGNGGAKDVDHACQKLFGAAGAAEGPVYVSPWLHPLRNSDAPRKNVRVEVALFSCIALLSPPSQHPGVRHGMAEIDDVREFYFTKRGLDRIVRSSPNATALCTPGDSLADERTRGCIGSVQSVKTRKVLTVGNWQNLGAKAVVKCQELCAAHCEDRLASTAAGCGLVDDRPGEELASRSCGTCSGGRASARVVAPIDHLRDCGGRSRREEAGVRDRNGRERYDARIVIDSNQVPECSPTTRASGGNSSGDCVGDDSYSCHEKDSGTLRFLEHRHHDRKPVTGPTTADTTQKSAQRQSHEAVDNRGETPTTPWLAEDPNSGKTRRHRQQDTGTGSAFGKGSLERHRRRKHGDPFKGGLRGRLLEAGKATSQDDDSLVELLRERTKNVPQVCK